MSSGSAAVPLRRRIASGIIDLIDMPILLGVLMGLILFRAPEAARNVILVVVNVLWLVFRDAFFSPARYMTDLKLVSQTGEKPTLVQAFLRNILLIIPFVLIVGYFVELISVITKGERIGDKIAKTKVVMA